VLVASTDGVGTKLKVATKLNVHHTIGIDLVAMCVNDTICCGAEPILFLDYVAMSQDNPPLLEQIVEGISQGCIEADTPLVGGETAILPDVYGKGEYDLAGFCVGVVERKRLIDGSGIMPGDALLGVASTGLHSNGFSLARKIVFEMGGLDVDCFIDECDATVGQLLLTPTRIYARAARRLLGHYKVKSVIHGMAHITGGGLRENLQRILPPGTQAVVRRHSWPVPPVFAWLQRLGQISAEEMDRVFNMGIGLVLVVRPFFAESIQQQLAEHGLDSWPIGDITPGSQEVTWE
jgi:phosphoribosylformylglycinamidine cyclo-ligase